MTNATPFLILAGGSALTAYGWWCLFRTESAMNFARSPIGGDAINRVLTILHGVLAIIAGPILIVSAIANYLGFRWAQW